MRSSTSPVFRIPPFRELQASQAGMISGSAESRFVATETSPAEERDRAARVGGNALPG